MTTDPSLIKLGIGQLAELVARRARPLATLGECRGQLQSLAEQQYLRWCCADVVQLGVRIIFTRDTGHHTSGWFRNPDYERCEHLSVSPVGLAPGAPSESREPVRGVNDFLLRAFWPEHWRLAWREGPKSPEGVAHEVVHWRVFCDARWVPIRPRREVYTKELTERGWQSASEQGIRIDSPLTP